MAGPARHCLCLKSQIVSVLSVGVCKLALHSRKKTGRVQRIASVRRSKSCGALKWVAKIFEGRAEFVDETVEIIGDEMPAKDYAQIISRVLKRKTTYNHVPREMHSSTSQADALTSRDADSFFAEMQTFESWLEKNVPEFTGLFRSRTDLLRKMSNRLAKTSATNHV